ncbi:hypothetical protein [Phytohabitans kaempferiae]|uniref:Uncharacterized protein n=1 Tax=Phytohabitans kaempferiae TaxID=1620943 RepID=A0ABV6MDG2_9ACTN
MGLNVIEPLLANGPWALALGLVVPVVALVVMFLWALRGVPAETRPEVIRAMAELVRALRGRRLP